MKNVMLDLDSDVNILPKKSWDLMGKPKLVWSPLQIWVDNQYKIYPIERLNNVEVKIDGVNIVADFKVIKIMEDIDPYISL